MFLASLRLGGLVGRGRSPRQMRRSRTYGRRLGLAFQIADDLLDVRGDAAALGKRVGKDSTAGKLTFPGLLGVDESRRCAEQLIDEACAALRPLARRASGLGAWPDSSWKGITDGRAAFAQSSRRATCTGSARPNWSSWPARCAKPCAALSPDRSAHFASNLGVVELCLALHTTFDFSRDRLIWDTGHQIYPHKLITGRYHEFGTIRTKGGLMGYPNPDESDYDLFMTGHAGCSVSTALGLKSGDDLMPGQGDRHAVAVIGDGAFPTGIVFEAMNNAGGLQAEKLLVVLNDNQMSICPRVGGLAEYLDRLRMNRFTPG